MKRLIPYHLDELKTTTCLKHAYQGVRCLACEPTKGSWDSHDVTKSDRFVSPR